jgi:LPXTG-motif cell wall-anchored protein
MKRIIFVVLTVGLLLTLIPGAVLALGVAMGPNVLEIPNALRGGEYERALTVFNPDKEETEYTLRTDGEAASWITLHDIETGEVIEGLTIPGNSSEPIIMKVAVPEDIQNGDYEATVFAETVPADSEGETGVSAILQAKAELTVKVTGEQVISGEVVSVKVRDAEVGFPLRLEVNFRNTGNVAVTPSIDCAILKEGEVISEFNYDETEVKAETQESIAVEWGTSDQETGEYDALVSTFLGDELIETKQVSFELLAPGTLSKQGELIELTYDGRVEAGATIKLQGFFENTGQGDALAKLIAEVYVDGTLIDSVSGEETLVAVGETGIAVAYYKLEEEGTYVIKGYISYEGKQTEEREMTLTTSADGEPTVTSPSASQPVTTTTAATTGGEPTENPDNESSNMWVYIVIGVVVVAAIGGGLFYLLKRKNKTSKRKNKNRRK